jgi:hypothetical protein
MTDPSNTFVTPIGRIVGGSLSRQQTKGFGGVVLDQPIWTVDLAVPKADALNLIAQIKAVAAADFAAKPHLAERKDFAFKYDDGDSGEANLNGLVYNTREGYRGHTVFHISNRFEFGTVGPGRQEIDPATIKTGDYVRLAGSIKGNDRDDKPGVYLNLSGAQFIRVGEAIDTGGGAANAADLFADQPVGEPPAGLPAHDIVANVIAPPPPPPAAGPTLTAKGVSEGCDVDAWVASGWTLDSLRTQGYIE